MGWAECYRELFGSGKCLLAFAAKHMQVPQHHPSRKVVRAQREAFLEETLDPREVRIGFLKQHRRPVKKCVGSDVRQIVGAALNEHVSHAIYRLALSQS